MNQKRIVPVAPYITPICERACDIPCPELDKEPLFVVDSVGNMWDAYEAYSYSLKVAQASAITVPMAIDSLRSVMQQATAQVNRWKGEMKMGDECIICNKKGAYFEQHICEECWDRMKADHEFAVHVVKKLCYRNEVQEDSLSSAKSAESE